MPDYFLAQSLVRFRASINAAFPHRDKSSDGWIGDASHAARESEHNPCWTCTGPQYGIVRATDTDIDDNDPGRDLRKMILASTIGHRAVWYVISNGVIYSRTHNWEARKYTGPNQHTKHVHVSINKTLAAAMDQTLLLKTAPAGGTPPAGGHTEDPDDMKFTDTVPGLRDKNGNPMTVNAALHEGVYGYNQTTSEGYVYETLRKHDITLYGKNGVIDILTSLDARIKQLVANEAVDDAAAKAVTEQLAALKAKVAEFEVPEAPKDSAPA